MRFAGGVQVSVTKDSIMVIVIASVRNEAGLKIDVARKHTPHPRPDMAREAHRLVTHVLQLTKVYWLNSYLKIKSP